MYVYMCVCVFLCFFTTNINYIYIYIYILNVVVNMVTTEYSKQQPHSCSTISIVKQARYTVYPTHFIFSCTPILNNFVYYRILTSPYIFKQILILRSAFFWYFTQRIMLILYLCFEGKTVVSTFKYKAVSLDCFMLENEVDRLSRNVGTKLLLFAT
jgi:hypothetical protein